MTARLRDLGLMGYADCVALQLSAVAEVQEGAPATLIYVEHPPVLTLGANFHASNLLMRKTDYEAAGIEVYKTDRGGDVTYHGPGQLVIYPIFDVAKLGKDLHKWLRDLEEAMLLTLTHYGVQGRRFPPNTGAWVGDEKVAAIGIKIKRWVSMHGIALNCDNDLKPFEAIIPCGIKDYGVASITSLTGKMVTIEDAKPIVTKAFEQIFEITSWV